MSRACEDLLNRNGKVRLVGTFPQRLLNQTTKDWHPRVVTLSETKGLSERFFAEFILSEVEGLRMTRPMDRSVKCTNVLWFDLATDERKILPTQEPLFHPDAPATLPRSVTTCTAIATPIAFATSFSFHITRALHA